VRGEAARLGLVLGLIFGGACFGCGGDESPSGTERVEPESAPQLAADPDNAPPVVESVHVEPQEPVPGDTLTATAVAVDPDGDPLRLFYSWSVNGQVMDVGSSAAFKPGKLGSGDRIMVEVVASDGRNESEPLRVSVGAGNRAPFIRSAAVDPADDAKPGDTLRALVDAEDPDGDPLRLEYTWLVNGSSRGNAESFETKGLRRGDEVQVKVVVGDGRERSPAVTSEVVELANRPPVFAGVPAREEAGGVYFYKLEARDPDGDRSLRYRLSEGPPGMSIDPLSGVVRWQPETTHAGVHPVEVVVRDRLGAETLLRWSLTVSVEQAPASAAGS